MTSVWSSVNVWARTQQYSGNTVKQLIVPSGSFASVSRGSTSWLVENEFGTWPAAPANLPIPGDGLWLRLPVGSEPGPMPTSASWVGHTELTRSDPSDVLASYMDALSFAEEGTGRPGLRSPQLGAVHAVLGYWTTGRMTPATVVMPTGTGKTETMLALLVAARPSRLLVIVPSDALRTQIAGKFETLGVLQQLGIVSNRALRPVVGRMEHRIEDTEVACEFINSCNVIVATPSVLATCPPEIREVIFDRCSHLFIDEAHHVAATTWSEIRDTFEDKAVVQFTATPFREDGRHLQGRMVYSFPLREAQKQGLFAQIDYTSVIDFDNVDEALASAAVERLRSDLAEGLDHILMARVRSLVRAKEVQEIYARIAEDLAPVVINSGMSQKSQRAAHDAVNTRSSLIIVCVNMLGEGFDLPALKVAAVHDPHKSLAVTLQFVGRFARTTTHGNLGGASVFVARNDVDVDRSLKELYAEDADWNLVLRDLTARMVDEQQETSDFEDGFYSLPGEVALRSLAPKMSTVVYRTPKSDWNTDVIVEFFGESSLWTLPIGLNQAAGVAWFVVERSTDVRWADIRTIEDTTYELYVLYFDSERRLLYINNSANDGVFEDLTQALVGDGARRFTGSTVYRVMADITRLVPTNVGVLDAHDRFRRFSMHVGSDVTASFSDAEASTKSQTNISGGGFKDGERVSISASLKGRIWSATTAASLKQWCDWCDGIGTKLLDETISIDAVIGQFILPVPLVGQPEGVLLGVEWPWSAYLLQPENLRLRFGDTTVELLFADLAADPTAGGDVFRFSVRTAAWEVNYTAKVENGRVVYASETAEEVTVVRRTLEQPLSQWLNNESPVLILNDDRIIEDDLVYQPKWTKAPYARANITVVDWSGIDLSVESQTREKLTHSIQRRCIERLLSEPWDIVLDDDGSGEVADVVALRVEPEGLLVKLVHCKYSHGDTPGARVADLYEVCGQAQKSIVWRRNDLRTLFEVLDYRARRKNHRDSVSPFEVGDIRKLYEVRDRSLTLTRRFEIAIAQPGLSASAATTAQLDLLASTQAYLRTTIAAPLHVWSSA